MATIKNPELTVTTNRPVDRAAVLVSCDLEFTDYEVNAMNILGLQYTLNCVVLNKDLLDEVPVVTYRALTFPRIANNALEYEHVVFGSDEVMDLLHDRLIGKDRMLAKLTLTNQETNVVVTAQTEVIAVDLAA